ncbi:hypothetical protein K1719_034358 [Acacia pycnantha]|nr:hypothetical protein K1719_034358 [Acacia pycnantha]
MKRKSDGQWVGVKPVPGSYIINLGDVLQVWTNGQYESVEHRVMVNFVKERFSIPFFLNPDITQCVEELTHTVNYRAYNWGKFALTRKRSNFMKLQAANIQIQHFKNIPSQILLEFSDVHETTVTHCC